MTDKTFLAAAISLLLATGAAQAVTQAVTLTAAVSTPVLHQYDDAPLTPDADDTAIWRHPNSVHRSLVIGSLKDAGLQVYNLRGRPVQTLYPENHPAVSELDPPVPGLTGSLAETSVCKGGRESYGRFNNVDVVYGVKVPGRGLVDLVVATDRGCDRLRFFAIDPNNRTQPLTDITDAGAPRVFPDRYLQPSQYQPAEHAAGMARNPVDEQNTAYGVGLMNEGGRVRVFVSQRSRSRVKELLLRPTENGTISYRTLRDYHFPVAYTLPAVDDQGTISWEACRENANDDLQFEGLAVDQGQNVLYAGQEVVGVWKLPIPSDIPATVQVIHVPGFFLAEKVKTFAMPYYAELNDGEYACEYGDISNPPAGAIVVEGNPALAGQFIEADAEGIAIVEKRGRRGYVVVSSQGDDTLHVFDRSNVFVPNRHLGVITVDGVHETDGLHIVARRFGPMFPDGLMAVHNGGAPEPADTSDINGYEYDGSTQFKLVNFKLPF